MYRVYNLHTTIINYIYKYICFSSFAIEPTSFKYLLSVEYKVFSFPLFLSHFYLNWPAERF